MSVMSSVAVPTARVGFASVSGQKIGRPALPVRARVAPTAIRCAAPGPIERAAARVESASTALNSAALATFTFATTAQPAHAGVKEAGDFLVAFWKFRTENVTNFLLLTVAPILVPYVIFKILIDKKAVVQREVLTEGKWDEFMAERGLDINILTLPQLNAFVKASEKGLLDDEMVVDFVKQLELNEQWKSSTINVVDPRAIEAKQRARAEKILEMQEKMEKETANN